MDMMIDLASTSPTLGDKFHQVGTQKHCPWCLHRIDPEPNYGLAFGGIGTYWVCDRDTCAWFYKIMDRDESGEEADVDA